MQRKVCSTEVDLKVDGKTTITAAVSPETADYKTIEWSVTGGDSDVIKFTVSDGGKSVDITALKAGEVTLTASIDEGETTAECEINVTKTDSTVTLSADNTVTYGDRLTLSAEITKNTSGISLMALENNVEFFNGGTSLGSAEVKDGKAELTVNVTKDKFSIGKNTITAVYGGSFSLNGNESTIEVTVNPKTISANITGKTSKTYDGKTDCEAEITSDGILEGDEVSITAESCKFDSANAGARTVTASGLTLGGAQSDFYKLEKDEIIGSGNITPKHLVIPEKEYTYDGKTSHEIELDGVNGETVKATLTADSKNAGKYEYDPFTKPSHYTVSFFANGVSSDNYTVYTAGTLTIDPLTAEIKWQDNTSFVYDGTEKTVKAEWKNKVLADDAKLEFKDNVQTEVGDYTASVTITGADSLNYIIERSDEKLPWEITAAGSGLTLSAANKTVTYGGNVSLTATIKRSETTGIMTMSAKQNEVEFFIGGNSIGSVKVTYTDGSDGTATFVLPATSAKHFKVGANTIRAEYSGSHDLSGSSAEITITVDPKPVTAKIDGETSKVYDGTNIITGLSLQLNGIEDCDKENVQAAAESYTFNSEDVETANTITANDAKLSGAQAGNYTLTVDTIEGKITPFPLKIQSYGFTYDGDNVFEIKPNGVNSETVNATLTAASKNAGTYTYNADENGYTIKLDSSNYSVGSADPLTINQCTATIKWSESEFYYDGKEKTVTATVTNAVSGDEFTISYKNNTGTDVGEYTAEITDLGNDNYTLDGAENVTLMWKISAVGREETNVKIDYVNETLSTSSDMEYSLDGETWISCTENMSVTAVGWKETESLTVRFRYAKDNNHNAGEVQTVVIPARPAAPDIEAAVTKTQDSITVAEIAGCEYSINGTTWQNSGTFNGLTEGTEYTVQSRIKATENAFASFAANKTVVTAETSYGKTELKTGETVETENGRVTNDGNKVEIEDKDGNKTTVTLPDGASDSVKVDDSGNIDVPAGSTVLTGDTTIGLPDGGTVKPDGTITADKIITDNKTISGDEVTVDKDGNITVSGSGTVQSGDTTLTLPDGGKISPDGIIDADKVISDDKTISGDEITVDKDGNITVSGSGKVQSGDTIVTGETVTVDKDGNIAIPDGGTVHSADGSETVIGKDGSISNNEVSIEPLNSVGYYDGNGEDHSINNGYIVLDIESADDDPLVKDLENGSDISILAAYDIRLLYNGRFEVQPNGTVTVTIAASAGADGTEKVLHANGSGFEDMNAEYDGDSKTFSFETDHFSIYVVAGAVFSDEPITPPSVPQTTPDIPTVVPAVTEKTDKNNDSEDISSGAEIVSAGEKISGIIFGNDGSRNIFVCLFTVGIAAAAVIFAKKKRQK